MADVRGQGREDAGGATGGLIKRRGCAGGLRRVAGDLLGGWAVLRRGDQGRG